MAELSEKTFQEVEHKAMKRLKLKKCGCNCSECYNACKSGETLTRIGAVATYADFDI